MTTCCLGKAGTMIYTDQALFVSWDVVFDDLFTVLQQFTMPQGKIGIECSRAKTVKQFSLASTPLFTFAMIAQ